LYRFLTENGMINVGPYGFPAAMQTLCTSSSTSYHNSNYHFERSVITDMTPEDRALAALKNHKEAEKRRRERINSHLDKLRGLLPCNSKVIYLWYMILRFLFFSFLNWSCFYSWSLRDYINTLSLKFLVRGLFYKRKGSRKLKRL